MKVNGISRIMGFEIQIKILRYGLKGKYLNKSSDEKKF